MTPRQGLISEAVKTALSQALAETAKSPKPLTVEQLILHNRPTLHKMLKNGHSHEDIAAVMTAHDLRVTGATIAAVLTKTKKKKGAKEKTKDKPAEANTTLSQAQTTAITAEWQCLSSIRKGFTKQELVAAMTDEIDAALAAGYDYSDLVDLMAKNGIIIAASSLQKYHRSAKQEEKPRSKAQENSPPSHPPSPKSAPHLPKLANANTIFDEEFYDA